MVSKTEGRGFESPNSCQAAFLPTALPARRIGAENTRLGSSNRRDGRKTEKRRKKDRTLRRKSRRERRVPSRLNSPVQTRISRRSTQTKDRNMARTNPLQFLQQVRTEVSKVVWPSRREVLLTTVMVFVMAALAATFFSLVDLLIRQGLTLVLNNF